MSQVIRGGTMISLIENGESLSVRLDATKPLYQTFKKGTQDFIPNWGTLPDGERPVIFPRVYAVMEALVLIPSDVTWKWNNVAMTFNSSGICTAPAVVANKVQQIDYNQSKALKLIGNIASAANNDSDIITFNGKVMVGNSSVNVSSETTLVIEEGTANLYRLFLSMADDVIDGDEVSLSVSAALYNQGIVMSSGVQYEFINMATDQVLRAKGTSPDFTITRAMIDSELMLLCKAYVGNTVVAQEQRQVWDSTDGYAIMCNFGTSTSQKSKEDRTYSYTLMNTRTSASVPGIVFTIKVIKSSDLSDITSQFTKTNSSITIAGAKIYEHKSMYIDVACQLN